MLLQTINYIKSIILTIKYTTQTVLLSYTLSGLSFNYINNYITNPKSRIILLFTLKLEDGSQVAHIPTTYNGTVTASYFCKS
jgi:hypothetical protein